MLTQGLLPLERGLHEGRDDTLLICMLSTVCKQRARTHMACICYRNEWSHFYA